MSIKVDASALKNVIRTVAGVSREQSRALISAGNTLRLEIKTGMMAESPGGDVWPPTSRWTGLAALRTRYYWRTLAGSKHFKYQERARKKSKRQLLTLPDRGKPALRKLANAVRYIKQTRTGTDGGIEFTAVRIGFLTPSAAKRAEYHAGAHVQTVTPKMRRFLFAVGLFIRSARIRIPPRRHVEPVYQKAKDRIAEGIRQRVASALSKKGM
jgi:hypothetical protein